MSNHSLYFCQIAMLQEACEAHMVAGFQNAGLVMAVSNLVTLKPEHMHVARYLTGDME